MLKNYVKIAWRNITKHKAFSFLNIMGLSVGIAFTILIASYVWGALQVNQNLKNADNQYIILSKWKKQNVGQEFTTVAELSRSLKTVYPGLVANYYNCTPAFTNITGTNGHFRTRLMIGDSTLLHMYGFNLLYGDPKSALKEPLAVVLTFEAAQKYFGKTNAIGQALSVEDFKGNKQSFMVTGVLDKLPENTITTADGYSDADCFVNAYAGKYFQRNLDGWNNTSVVDHIELQPGVNPAAVESAIMSLLKKNSSKEIIDNLTPHLTPLKKYYLDANNGLMKKTIWTLLVIAIFILLMAVINFVNICIGQSAGRMKEIGVRKVIGGMRKQLLYQFLAESILMVSLATLLSMVIYVFAAPYFGELLNKKISPLNSFPLYFTIYPVSFALLTGLITGIYPAMILSGFTPIDSLNGKSTLIKENSFFKKILVAFQFTIAAVVFIGAIIISQQLNLFFNGDLGYNKDYIIYAQVPRDWSPEGLRKMQAIRSQFPGNDGVNNVSLSWEIPASIDWQSGISAYREGADPTRAITLQHLSDDNQFAETYGIPVRAGAFFKPIVSEDDSSQAVINEAALKGLGFKNPEDAIGQTIAVTGDFLQIVGVVGNFHFGSMQTQIQPMLFTNVTYSGSYRYLSFKLKSGDMLKNISALQSKWNQLMPNEPFNWSFMDDALKKVYASEIQLKSAAYIATLLAVIIVLLGILGLVSLSIQKRTKEIGIRKVLGSPVNGIITLFLKDFMLVIFMGCLLACPISYILMNRWLNDYAYRIDISMFPFTIAAIVLLIITTVLIVVQTTPVAMANPIKSLKSE